MFDFIASLLYPKRCVGCKKSGNYICDNCFAKISFLEYQLCGICQKGSIDGLTHPKCKTPYAIDGTISIISYKGIVKKLLYQFKYKPFLSELKVPLSKLFYEGLIQQEAFTNFISKENVLPATRSFSQTIKSEVWITSVPLHVLRERKRGYNQSELLAKELSGLLKIEYMSSILDRRVNTKPQFELKKKERKQNILGAFNINSKFKSEIKGKRVILVDDITTTGATLRECGKVLKQSGAGKVLGVTLAHEG